MGRPAPKAYRDDPDGFRRTQADSLRRSTARYAKIDDPTPWLCAAQGKQSGERCGNFAARGSVTCKSKHSGGLGGGVPKHGRFAFKIGTEMAESNGRWLEEIRALDLSDHLAALASVTQRQITRCEELDTPEFRRSAIALFDEAAEPSLEPASRAIALNRLGQHLRRGASEDRALRALSATLVDFAKRLEVAKSIDLQEKTTITQRQAEALVGGIITLLQQQGELGTEILKRLDREVFQRNGIRIAG